MPFIASVPDERNGIFGEERSVGFSLTLSSNKGVIALKKRQCLKTIVGSWLWQYWWDNSLFGMVKADHFLQAENAIT